MNTLLRPSLHPADRSQMVQAKAGPKKIVSGQGRPEKNVSGQGQPEKNYQPEKILYLHTDKS